MGIFRFLTISLYYILPRAEALAQQEKGHLPLFPRPDPRTRIDVGSPCQRASNRQALCSALGSALGWKKK